MAKKSREKELEEFLWKQIKKLMKIQEENEKNLWYIG